MEPWQVAAALGFTAIALAYLGRVAKDVCPFPCAKIRHVSVFQGFNVQYMAIAPGAVVDQWLHFTFTRAKLLKASMTAIAVTARCW